MKEALILLSVVIIVVGSAGCVRIVNDNRTETESTSPELTDSPSLRLELNSLINETIHVNIKRTNDSKVVLNETYPPEAGIIELNDEMADGVNYVVRIRTTDSLLWEKRIDSAEGYRLLIQENGSVSIEDHDES